MATINATLSVSSGDLSSSSLALNKTMTMTKAGTTTGLEFTSGLVNFILKTQDLALLII